MVLSGFFFLADGQDFTGVDMNITFERGQELRQQIYRTIDIIDDSCVEEEETFTLLLSSYDSDIMISTNAMAKVAIVDNDGKIHAYTVKKNHSQLI